MGILTDAGRYETLKVRLQDEICFIQIDRPEANNTINDTLVDEFTRVLAGCEREVKIVVIEGLPQVFCFGADFKDTGQAGPPNPEPMYKVWLQLAFGPYITIAHVRGQANAGGIGFVAACDIVLCDEQATFSLSELLFGLMPACVLPFLMRRVGAAKANYMTLMTETVAARTAQQWGLVDECAEDSQNLLRKKLLRLRRLSKPGVARYKRYLETIDGALQTAMQPALDANVAVFSDQENLAKIARYVKTGQFPWEG
jgi:polyketide biosynthesis enoyl-CoA hydratase PksH